MKPIDASNFMYNTLPSIPRRILPFGIKEMDDAFGGLLPGCLYTIAGTPSSGKTSLMTTMIVNQISNHDLNILVSNIESANEYLIANLVSVESGIERRLIKQGKLSEEEYAKISKATEKLSKTKMFITEDNETDVDSLIDEVNEINKNNNDPKDKIDVIYIDYLQLLTIKDLPYGSYTRNDELSYILKKLKQLAKSLDIPVVILSQLNRNSAQRKKMLSYKPLLTDLRESGTIEDISDMVLFLHRPELEYYSEQDPEGRNIRDVIELHVAKNRVGPNAEFEMHFNQKTGKVEDFHTFYSNHT